MCSVKGCSLKAVAAIRPEKILLETGEENPLGFIIYISKISRCPWCSMKPTHVSKIHLDTLRDSLRSLYSPPATKPENFISGKSIKRRNEPSTIGSMAWVIHKLNEGVQLEKVTEKVWKNTMELFQLKGLE